MDPQHRAQGERSVEELFLGNMHQHRTADHAIEQAALWRVGQWQCSWLEATGKLGMKDQRFGAKLLHRLDPVGIEPRTQKSRHVPTGPSPDIEHATSRHERVHEVLRDRTHPSLVPRGDLAGVERVEGCGGAVHGRDAKAIRGVGSRTSSAMHRRQVASAGQAWRATNRHRRRDPHRPTRTSAWMGAPRKAREREHALTRERLQGHQPSNFSHRW